MVEDVGCDQHALAGHLAAPLDAEQEQALAHTPADELLDLPFLAEVTSGAVGYGLAKRANHLRVQAASDMWGRRGARINSISPGVISTPMGQQELAGDSGTDLLVDGGVVAALRAGVPSPPA